jgi:hypothetical protein
MLEPRRRMIEIADFERRLEELVEASETMPGMTNDRRFLDRS